MKTEKKQDNYKWYLSDNLRFRVQQISDNESIVWAIQGKDDLCYCLVIWDFLERCENELRLKIEIDNSWILTGFKIKHGDEKIVIGEIVFFLSEFELMASNTENTIEHEDWYSINK